MAVVMYVDFPHQGAFGEELAKQLSELAQSINQEPGFIWKLWTEDQSQKTAGGVYLFDSRDHAQQYLSKHTERLSQWGYTGIRGRIFEINEPLSFINHGPQKL